jgi:type IV pilus assembly protein PilO
MAAMPNWTELLARWGQVPQRTRIASVVGIVLLMTGAYYALVHQDLQGRAESAQAALQQAEGERAEKQAYAAHLPLYEARLTELRQRLVAARAQLPDSADVPQLLSQISQIARGVGVHIERFEPQAEVPRDFFAESAFALQVRGSYHEIGMFLDQVSRMDRIVNVADLHMAEPKIEAQRVLVTAHVNLRAYRSMAAQEAEQAHKKDAPK